MDDLRKRFGRLVLANRRKRGFTQQQLADRAGISIEMINRVERGVTAPRFPNIEKLASALEVDPAELFTPDLATGAGERRALTDVVARLSGLSDRDLRWVDRLLDAALMPRT
jgi:transcriptional regulator with XRE-family HTH domain